MAKSDGYKREFKPRFRRHAFGWKSQPAIARVKAAVSELRQVARTDANLTAGGAVLFLEKVTDRDSDARVWCFRRERLNGTT